MKEERYRQILDLLSSESYVSVESLSRSLYVSAPTVRRDLSEMQEMGLVRRNHGGAILRLNDAGGSPVSFRFGVNSGAKMRLSRAAAGLLRDDISIFLDESTTTQHIIDLIRKNSNIRIVTNSLAVLQAAYKSRIAAYCLGGKLHFDTMSFLGKEAEDMVRRYGIDIMFFSSSGLNSHSQIVDYNGPSNALRQKVLEYSDKKVFLCDQSKFNKNAAYSLAALSDVDQIFLDAPLPDHIHAGNAKITIV